MPAALGLQESTKKGDFPYMISAYENEGKKWDSLPPISYYGIDRMMPVVRKEFEVWHARNRRKEFDYNKEITDYCQQDVTVLKKAVLAFRQLFLNVTTHSEKAAHGICPFGEGSFTIASACSRVFCQLFLQPNTLALMPSEGYQPQRTHSLAALRWLKYLNETDKLQPAIRHARNGDEKVILGRAVDGWRETLQHREQVFEFMGCYYHACQRCTSREMLHPHRKLPMGQIYDETMARLQQLRNAGYEVIVMWECQWKEMLKRQDVAAVVNDFQIEEPLDCRAALAGGRTNALRLHYKAGPDERINYFDIKVRRSTHLYKFMFRKFVYIFS